MNPRVKLHREQILRVLDGHPVQIQTSVGMLEVEAVADPEWQPLQRVEISPHVRVIYERTMGEQPVEVWRNDTYEVIVKPVDTEETMGGSHLSIKRLDRAAVHNWRHFQQIKNEICGDTREGFELYPDERRLVDNANQYHLWVLPEGVAVPVGFEGGMVVRADDDVQAYNELTEKGRQEPYQPGITAGETVQAMADESGATTEALAAMRDMVKDGLLPGGSE